MALMRRYGFVTAPLLRQALPHSPDNALCVWPLRRVRARCWSNYNLFIAGGAAWPPMPHAYQITAVPGVGIVNPELKTCHLQLYEAARGKSESALPRPPRAWESYNLPERWFAPQAEPIANRSVLGDALGGFVLGRRRLVSIYLISHTRMSQPRSAQPRTHPNALWDISERRPRPLTPH